MKLIILSFALKFNSALKENINVSTFPWDLWLQDAEIEGVIIFREGTADTLE